MKKLAIFIRLALPSLILVTSGCVSFGSKAVPSMLVLTSQHPVADGSLRSAVATDTMVIETPVVPQMLNTSRVPVYFGNNQLAYLKDAIWAEKPATLLQNLLIETISAKGKRLVLSDTEAGSGAKNILSGTLSGFGIDSRTMQAILIYDAIRTKEGGVVEKRRFEFREPVSAVNAIETGRALNEIANRFAISVSDWSNVTRK